MTQKTTAQFKKNKAARKSSFSKNDIEVKVKNQVFKKLKNAGSTAKALATVDEVIVAAKAYATNLYRTQETQTGKAMFATVLKAPPATRYEQAEIMFHGLLQARKNYSGKIFEQVVYNVLDFFNIPSTAQPRNLKAKGSKGPGANPDAVIPSQMAYFQNPKGCVVLSIKSSVKERWSQALVDGENVHLFTCDATIKAKTLDQIAKFGLTLIVPRSVIKANPVYQNYKNIVDVETFVTKCVQTYGPIRLSKKMSNRKFTVVAA